MGFLEDMVKNLEPLEVYKLDQFKGMQIIVDPNLPDNRWYMAVSKDIQKALQESEQGVKND